MIKYFLDLEGIFSNQFLYHLDRSATFFSMSLFLIPKYNARAPCIFQFSTRIKHFFKGELILFRRE